MNSITVMGMKGYQVTVLHKLIMYIQADGNYCTLYLADKQKIVLTRAMASVLPQLGSGFIRTHKTYVVNREFIGSINPFEFKATLKNGVHIPISRRRLEQVCDEFGR